MLVVVLAVLEVRAVVRMVAAVEVEIVVMGYWKAK